MMKNKGNIYLYKESGIENNSTLQRCYPKKIKISNFFINI